MKISYAITTNNEGGYIHDLLTLLYPTAEDAGDEIVVLDDFSTDDFTCSILHGYEGLGAIRLYQRALNGDFAAQKNYLNSLCEGDFIFQIDADETLHHNLMKYIHDIVDNNPEIDLYHIPRVNVVNGLTQADIDRWGWNVNELGWINFPDYQSRLFRNHPDIKWQGKVHERITGHKTHAPLPPEEEWALYHIKDIVRQRNQNNFYETL